MKIIIILCLAITLSQAFTPPNQTYSYITEPRNVVGEDGDYFVVSTHALGKQSFFTFHQSPSKFGQSQQVLNQNCSDLFMPIADDTIWCYSTTNQFSKALWGSNGSLEISKTYQCPNAAVGEWKVGNEFSPANMMVAVQNVESGFVYPFDTTEEKCLDKLETDYFLSASPINNKDLYVFESGNDSVDVFRNNITESGKIANISTERVVHYGKSALIGNNSLLVLSYGGGLQAIRVSDSKVGPFYSDSNASQVVAVGPSDNFVIVLEGNNNSRVSKYTINDQLQFVNQSSVDFSNLTISYQTTFIPYYVKGQKAVMISTIGYYDLTLQIIFDVTNEVKIKEIPFNHGGILSQFHKFGDQYVQFTVNGPAFFSADASNNLVYEYSLNYPLCANYSSPTEPNMIYTFLAYVYDYERYCYMTVYDLESGKIISTEVGGCPQSTTQGYWQIISASVDEYNTVNGAIEYYPNVLVLHNSNLVNYLDQDFSNSYYEGFLDDNHKYLVFIGHKVASQSNEAIQSVNQNVLVFDFMTLEKKEEFPLSLISITKVNETSATVIAPGIVYNVIGTIDTSNFENHNEVVAKIPNIKQAVQVNGGYGVITTGCLVYFVALDSSWVAYNNLPVAESCYLVPSSQEKFLYKIENAGVGSTFILEVPQDLDIIQFEME